MYKATITKKEIAKGLLRVSVIFQNEKGDVFDDQFETNQAQPPTWVADRIRLRLKELDTLEQLETQIESGEFVPRDATPTEKQLYRERATEFVRLMDMARLGVVNSDDPLMNELRDWLRVNFKREYIDTF